MSARLVTLAVLLAVVLASDASAQSPPTFGGGRLQAAALPKTYEPTVGISLQPRGSQIAVRFDTTLLCGKDGFEATGRKLVTFDGTSFSATAASIDARRAAAASRSSGRSSGTVAGSERRAGRCGSPAWAPGLGP